MAGYMDGIVPKAYKPTYKSKIAHKYTKDYFREEPYGDSGADAEKRRQAIAAAQQRQKVALAAQQRTQPAPVTPTAAANSFDAFKYMGKNFLKWFSGADSVREFMGYPAKNNWGEGGTTYSPAGYKYALDMTGLPNYNVPQKPPFRPYTGSGTFYGSQGEKNRQSQYLGSYGFSPVFKNSMFGVPKPMPMSDIWSTPYGQPSWSYTPEPLPPNAWNYDPAGSPYAYADDVPTYGGGGGGGGYGGYSSSPGYYGGGYQDRAKYYENLLQWNIT